MFVTDFKRQTKKKMRDLGTKFLVSNSATASAKRLYRDIGVEELVPWIWSGTNHHDISSFCPPEDSRSRGGEPTLGTLSGLILVCNC